MPVMLTPQSAAVAEPPVELPTTRELTARLAALDLDDVDATPRRRLVEQHSTDSVYSSMSEATLYFSDAAPGQSLRPDTARPHSESSDLPGPDKGVPESEVPIPTRWTADGTGGITALARRVVVLDPTPPPLTPLTLATAPAPTTPFFHAQCIAAAVGKAAKAAAVAKPAEASNPSQPSGASASVKSQDRQCGSRGSRGGAKASPNSGSRGSRRGGAKASPNDALGAEAKAKATAKPSPMPAMPKAKVQAKAASRKRPAAAPAAPMRAVMPKAKVKAMAKPAAMPRHHTWGMPAIPLRDHPARMQLQVHAGTEVGAGETMVYFGALPTIIVEHENPTGAVTVRGFARTPIGVRATFTSVVISLDGQMLSIGMTEGRI